MITSILKNQGYRTIVFVSTYGGFTYGSCNSIATIKKYKKDNIQNQIMNNSSNLKYKNDTIQNQMVNNVYNISYDIGKYSVYGFMYGGLFPISVPLSMYLLSDMNSEG